MSDNNLTLLVVDDDQEIRELLEKILTRYNYQVISAVDGVDMFEKLAAQQVDIILLDVMLPGEDGFVLCQKVRRDHKIPIIMLTAIGETADRIVGLEMGADDYLTKPFDPRELIARIKAVTRRTQSQAADSEPVAVTFSQRDVVHFAGWTLNKNTRSLTSEDNVEIALSTGEYDLLVAFLEYAQKVLSRDQLLDLTKNRSAGPFDRSIDIQVSRLRHKIEVDSKKPLLIKTVRGGGYMFTAKVD